MCIYIRTCPKASAPDSTYKIVAISWPCRLGLQLVKGYPLRLGRFPSPLFFSTSARLELPAPQPRVRERERERE